MCDATVSPWVVSLAGSALMIMCYAFIGPAPYLAFFEPNFTTVCSSLVAQGSFTCNIQTCNIISSDILFKT